ncbi:MAG: M28 family peptidase [Bacillota bacterium]|nr:M28 family peptidase [Bacillota bacterium]
MSRKKNIVIIALLALILSMSACAKPVSNVDVPEAVSEVPEVVSIDPQYINTVLDTLISEDFTGRLPGTEGNKKVEEFLQSEMETIGLSAPEFASSYLHGFDLLVPLKQKVTEFELVDVDGAVVHKFDFGDDFTEYIARDFAMGIGEFQGAYTIVDDPFVVGKVDEMTEDDIWVFSRNATASSSYDVFFKSVLNSDRKPKVIIYESDQLNNDHFILSPYTGLMQHNDNENGVLIYRVSPGAFQMIKDADQKFLKVSTAADVKTVEVSNVVGMIDGKADHGYVISAHFDHLGDNLDGTVNYGALDNASGVSAMMALAEAMVRDGEQELDYYFIAFNGEEEGLHGSTAFVRENFLDVEKFQIINMDMLGSNTPIEFEISATHPQSTELSQWIFENAKEYGINAITSNIGASDHFPFEQAGFAAVTLIEFDKRFYHTPYDTKDASIDLEHLADLTQFVFELLQ